MGASNILPPSQQIHALQATLRRNVSLCTQMQVQRGALKLPEYAPWRFHLNNVLKYLIQQRELVGGVEREAAAAHSIFEPADSMHDTLPSHSETERYLRRSLGIPPHKPVHLKSWPGVHPFCGTRLLTLEQAIQLAIWSSPEKRLKIQQIYDALQDRYPILRMDPDKRWMVFNWARYMRFVSVLINIKQRSIRHKLSHMHMFRQPYRHWSYPRRGKGDYWLIDISKGTGNKAAAKKKSTKTDSSVSSDSGHEYSSPESGSSITLSPVPHSYIKLAAEDSGQYSGNVSVSFLPSLCQIAQHSYST